MCHSDNESAARTVEKCHPTTHTHDASHIATTRHYLVTALETAVALVTEPSSSDKDGSGEIFAKKKKKSVIVNMATIKAIFLILTEWR